MKRRSLAGLHGFKPQDSMNKFSQSYTYVKGDASDAQEFRAQRRATKDAVLGTHFVYALRKRMCRDYFEKNRVKLS